MTCPKCGKTVPDGSTFCNHCGKKLTVETRKGIRVRGNGMGTAYRRGRSWTACVIVGWRMPDDPSKPKIPIKRTKAGFSKKADALAYCQTLFEQGLVRPKQTPSLSYYWRTYESGKLKTLSNSKQTAYKIAWNRMEKLHSAQVDLISVNDLQTYLDQVCPSYYTMKDCKSLLVNLFRIAAADGFANDRIPSMVTLPELEENERIPFSENEQKSLWKLYDSGDLVAAVPIVMIYTGMMPGECMQLRTENINLEDRTITGVGLKTKVRRKSPVLIAEVLLPVLQDLIDHARPDGFLWTQSKDEWYKDYYAVLQRAGCRKLSPYSCRHTTASALAITENIAPQTIKKVMRWSTSAMLDRYAHPTAQDALDAVDAIKRFDSTTDLLPT